MGESGETTLITAPKTTKNSMNAQCQRAWALLLLLLMLPPPLMSIEDAMEKMRIRDMLNSVIARHWALRAQMRKKRVMRPTAM